MANVLAIGVAKPYGDEEPLCEDCAGNIGCADASGGLVGVTR